MVCARPRGGGPGCRGVSRRRRWLRIGWPDAAHVPRGFELVREVTQAILGQSGFAVLTAENRRQGVETFRARAATIDAVVLDMMMPDTGGEEAHEQMRRIRPGAPVVVSSGYTEQDVSSRLAAHGPVTFVQKPYQPAALTAALRAVLEGTGAK